MNFFYNRSFFKQTSQALQLAGQALLRPPCLLCGGAVEYNIASHHLTDCCEACRQQLPWLDTARCPQCALPTHHGSHCGQCLQHVPAFDQTLVTFRYAFPLDHVIQRFKYHQSLALGAWLMRESLAVLSPPQPKSSMVIPMPMHPSRLRLRGFQHAAVLAKQLADSWQLPYSDQHCQRIKDTPLLEGLRLTERVQRLRSAFDCPRRLDGQHVLMVDDVMTTGASMHALAKALKQAGARHVTALVLARTLKD